MARVLVVEDYEALRNLYRIGLETAGHEVLMTGAGNEAKQLLTANIPDILITDLQLPDVLASELIQLACNVNPVAKILVISGESEEVVRRSGISDDVQVLLKPFEISDLICTVEELNHGKRR